MVLVARPEGNAGAGWHGSARQAVSRIGLLLILLALTELPVTIRTAQGGTSIVGRINLVAQYA